MLFVGQEPVPLLKRKPVLMALVVTMLILALGILLLFLLFRLVCAALLLSVLPWDTKVLGLPRVDPDINLLSIS